MRIKPQKKLDCDHFWVLLVKATKQQQKIKKSVCNVERRFRYQDTDSLYNLRKKFGMN